MKRIGVFSDLHCGHRAGLTPPGYQWQTDSDDPIRNKFALAQADMWSRFKADLDKVKAEHPIDIAIINGDSIDGKGTKSGGTELITSDRKDQCIIAARCIREIDAETILMTYGTGYHVGNDEDWERDVAEAVDALKIESHGLYDIEGLVLDARHFVSSSIIPHGRFTALARENLWANIWADRYPGSKPDILIRSHVHYYGFCGDAEWMGMTTPALQGMGSKFGSRICSGKVDFGFIIIDINQGDYRWKAYTHPVITGTREVLRLS